MNSPLALFLATSGGLGLLVGSWYLTTSRGGAERQPSPDLRAFGIACLLVAGQEYGALEVYRAIDAATYLGAVRLHTGFAFAAPVAILWFVALHTGMKVRWPLWIHAGAAATMIAINLASPATIHFSDVLEVGGIVLPWGERLTQAVAIPSRGPPLGDYLIGLFCCLCVYALWTSSRHSTAESKRPLEAGLGILIATIVVELLDPRRVSALPVDEFGLLAFVVVLGLGLRRSRASRIIPHQSRHELGATDQPRNDVLFYPERGDRKAVEHVVGAEPKVGHTIDREVDHVPPDDVVGPRAV
jgi:hypothetical protein